MIQSHLLTTIILVPTLAFLAICLTPAHQALLIRRISNIGLGLTLLLSLFMYASYNHVVGGYQFIEKLSWVPSLGISYHLGVDGINALMIILVCLGAFCGSLVSSITNRVKEYYILLLLIAIGTLGAFLSLDIFFFYFAHEIAAIPTFLMIAIWGSDKKEYAATKLTLYLTAGASIALIGLIGLFVASGLNTFDVIALKAHLVDHPINPAVTNWIFPLIVLGFGITLTMWPFYTWAPVGYASAPTAVSMLHAGVLKKLGAYAILRFAIDLMPQAAQTWMPVVATLAVINILFCGLVALTKRDMKYVLAYSSCSHMGYILLGLACLNTVGLNGVVYLMFAHGVMACLSFAITGYIAQQTNTRNLDELGGLMKRLPFIGTCLMMAAFASAGVPGFANFVAEMLVLLGSWDTLRWQTVLAILGIVISAIYMLKFIRLSVQGPLNPRFSSIVDAKTLVSKLPYVILLAALFITGLCPNLILKRSQPAVEQIVNN